MSDPTFTPAVSTSGLVVETDPAQRSQGMIAHLAGIFGILGAGIFYLIKKSDVKAGPFVQQQMKESVNYQIAVVAAYIVLVVLMIICGILATAVSAVFLIGTMLVGLLCLAVSLGNLILVILNGMKANKGIAARYPFKIAVLK